MGEGVRRPGCRSGPGRNGESAWGHGRRGAGGSGGWTQGAFWGENGGRGVAGRPWEGGSGWQRGGNLGGRGVTEGGDEGGLVRGVSQRVAVLAIIPARGGSKGIPRKNVQTVGGVPLVVRAVRAATKAKRVSRVVVSTDDAEIGQLSSEAGAEVVWRPPELSGDSSPSEAALLHVLHFLRERDGYVPACIAFLQCTSPFTQPGDVDGVLELVAEKGYDSAFTGTPTHGFLWRKLESGLAEGVNHEKTHRAMRQQREPEYLETGAVYGMRTGGFLERGHRFFGKTGIYVVPRLRALEIDEPEDLVLARALHGIVEADQERQKLPRRVRALVLDFDGVLTDNRVLVMEDGKEGVLCSRADGMGLEMLRRKGIRILILSKERNAVVGARAEKLGVECLQGIDDKLPAMRRWVQAHGIAMEEVVYAGNDVNDIECLRICGCGVCVADAHPEAKEAADIVLPERGGQGAVRMLCEWIVERTEHGHVD